MTDIENRLDALEGQSNTVMGTDGSTATLEPGEDIVFTTQTPDAIEVKVTDGSVVIEVNALGGTGEIGPTGPTGPQGEPGSVGPTGPQGEPGSVGHIVGSFNNWDDFLAFDPAPRAGDFYLVGNELVMWDFDHNQWVSAGSIEGPAGPTGPQGESGPQGTQGLQGPTGPAGEDGEIGSIVGAFNTWEEFEAFNPTPQRGDFYLVGGHLYFYDFDHNTWVDAGSPVGPVGPTGPTGPTGEPGSDGQNIVRFVFEYDGDGNFIGYAQLEDGSMIPIQNPEALIGPQGDTGPAGGGCLTHICNGDAPYSAYMLSTSEMDLGHSAMQVGMDTVASGTASFAQGQGGVASGDYSHAEGENTLASGEGSHAEGSATTAAESYSHAEGIGTLASGDYSHAQGAYTEASGLVSHAQGSFTVASGTDSHAEGYRTTASGRYSHAEGDGTVASERYSHAEGDGTVASGVSSHAEGTVTTASGRCSHSEGGATEASGMYSHAEGYLTEAGGYYSHAEGRQTTASGIDSHAEGAGTTASGQCSHAEGYVTIASGTNSHVEGTSFFRDTDGTYYSNPLVAEGIASHAEGFGTTAQGTVSHAEGFQTTASGKGAHAEGDITMAVGVGSHAEGYQTEAGGDYSHAEGQTTIASGNVSHAEGVYTQALGYASHSEGQDTAANGTASHAGGLGTYAEFPYQTIIGTYNAGTFANDAFVIGNGYLDSDLNPIGSNAFRFTFSGQAYGEAWNLGEADYAEMMEWADGNPDKEERIGYFVTLDGDKIRKFSSTDSYLFGIISASPGVVGNNSGTHWKKKFLTDKYGRILNEEVLEAKKTYIFDEKTQKMEEHIELIQGKRPKLHPDYDPTQVYIPRDQRPEWAAVGMLGQLMAHDDGTCQANGYCLPADEGIATASEKGYRVLKRVDDDLILIFFDGAKILEGPDF